MFTEALDPCFRRRQVGCHLRQGFGGQGGGQVAESIRLRSELPASLIATPDKTQGRRFAKVLGRTGLEPIYQGCRPVKLCASGNGGENEPGLTVRRLNSVRQAHRPAIRDSIEMSTVGGRNWINCPGVGLNLINLDCVVFGGRISANVSLMQGD